MQSIKYEKALVITPLHKIKIHTNKNVLI